MFDMLCYAIICQSFEFRDKVGAHLSGICYFNFYHVVNLEHPVKTTILFSGFPLFVDFCFAHFFL